MPPRPGEFSGGIGYSIILTDENDVERSVFDCQLSIVNTVRSWEYGVATNECGLDNVVQFFDGGGQYGVTLMGVTVRTPALLDPGDTYWARLDMFAWANRTAIDWSGQISAKLGDPSNPALRSAFSVEIVDATAPPTPVPEPGSAWLAGLALMGLSLTRAKRSARARVA